MTDNSPLPARAHTLILKIGADTSRGLADELRHLADDIQRGDISAAGCLGGPSAGYSYEYRVDPGQTHDRYFAQLEEWNKANG